jgi:hypothetical protein
VHAEAGIEVPLLFVYQVRSYPDSADAVAIVVEELKGLEIEIGEVGISHDMRVGTETVITSPVRMETSPIPGEALMPADSRPKGRVVDPSFIVDGEAEDRIGMSVLRVRIHARPTHIKVRPVVLNGMI